ncbi:MAG: alkaline phosphatase, partial [Bacteroidales bacterium]|nr:alkaline phosphatase [Bacteroidales bacterium]
KHKQMKKLIYLLIILFLFSACAEKEIQKESKPKNIILMIGDGMGLSQMYAAYTVKKDKTNMARCKHIGLVNTSSANDLITDSAASGTAIATGNKTNNGHICVDKDGNKYITILEIAEEHGKATGLVATSTITHATPAAFIAHNTNRGNYEDIAKDFLNTDIDVFFGGGKNHFAKRKDSLNLIDSLKARNYNVVFDVNKISTIKTGKTAGLFYDEHPPKRSEGRNDFLEQASLKAIEILDQDEDGFFIMIEGSQIDWAGHDNDLQYLLDETLEFDDVVGKILDFAEKDGETLVIVTADHECGGFTVVEGDLEKGTIKGHFSSGNHTPVMVPLYAYGPGSENFCGVYDNTEIFEKMKKAFGF